jgi:hypothetical protein
MLSVRGIYENGKITIKKDPSTVIPPDSKLIITFTNQETAESSTQAELEDSFLAEEIETNDFEMDDEFIDENPDSEFDSDIHGEEIYLSDEKAGDSEDYYESLREFERVPATGKITIIDAEDTNTYALFDYSQGGLCFVADKNFEVGVHISAGITDPSNTDTVLMELDMEVRGVFISDNKMKMKIGCMFENPVDEDLWHGLLQFLG